MYFFNVKPWIIDVEICLFYVKLLMLRYVRVVLNPYLLMLRYVCVVSDTILRVAWFYILKSIEVYVWSIRREVFASPQWHITNYLPKGSLPALNILCVLKSRLEYLSLKDVGTTCNVSVINFKSNSIRILHNCRIG